MSDEYLQAQPRYKCDSTGVFYIDVQVNKDGSVSEKAPLRLSDYIELIGLGCDQDHNYYRIIEWYDSLTFKPKTAVLPMSEIGSNWQALLKHGLTVHSGRRKRDFLADYLQTSGSHTPYKVTQKCGWQGKAYLLPNGDIIYGSETVEQDRIIYNGDTSQAAAYRTSGSLQDWQKNVVRLAAGNSRLLLALGTALAAPLLSLVNEQNGGFHIYGDSSDGKTTAALTALSVFGNPQALKMTWRGTDLGFSNAALARNDNLLVLDEIGEAHPKTISRTAYSVINGKSKIQGAKDGGNRASQEWRVLLFSTGEYSMNAYMHAADEKWEAGQTVRLPSIPASTQYGIYENLHEFKSGAALSEHLQLNIQAQYGIAGREWVKQLANLPVEVIISAQNTFMATLPHLDGQARRVAKRFALLAAALELAHEITGLPKGEGMKGIRRCFDDWFALNGAGKQEDRQILNQAMMFMQTQAMYFINTEMTFIAPSKEPPGFVKTQTEDDLFYIYPKVFLESICVGFDKNKVIEVLSKAGWLQKMGYDGRWQAKLSYRDKNTQKVISRGYFYVLKGIEPADMIDDIID